MTSHDVVNIVRKKTGIKRVGHAGTLDPLAQGILVIAVGRENTKRLNEYVKGEKEYVAEFKLGFESATDDEEGDKSEVNTKIKPNSNEIQTTLKKFVGKIKQTPPLYSAIKIAGKEAYKYARKGKTVELKPREVEIKKIELLSYEYPLLKLKILCGPGVYIRSLARNIGEKLKTGAYLKSLIRTRVAEFRLENAIRLDQ